MNSKTLLEVSDWLRAQAANMAADEARAAATASKPTNIYGDPAVVVTYPGDPGFKGATSVGKDWKDINGALLGPYQHGDGWQIVVRTWSDDPMDRNKIVREKFLRGECTAPRFPNEKQEWEAGT